MKSAQAEFDAEPLSRRYVHANDYSGYDELFRGQEVLEVGCWMHARRKFDEAGLSRPVEATEIMARIARPFTDWRMSHSPEGIAPRSVEPLAKR